MKLAERARASGAHPQPACRWYRHRTMPDLARRLSSGTILVEARENPPAGRAVVYARLSAHGQCADLDRQIARLTARAIGQGIAVAEVVCEGRLGHEPPAVEAQGLPADPQVRVIVVGHRHRLARLGVELLEAAPSGGPPGRGRRSRRDQRQPGAEQSRCAGELLRPAVRPPRSRNRVLLALACAKRASEAARVVGEDD
jgi:putative resolvase